MKNYEYMPLTDLEDAYGVWPKCDDLWRPVDDVAAFLSRYEHTLSDLDAGAPVILECSSGGIFAVNNYVVVREKNDYPKCPICGCAIKDGGDVSELYPAVICGPCKEKELKMLTDDGKCVVYVPELDMWLPASSMSDITKRYYDGPEEDTAYMGAINVDWVANACKLSETPNAAVAIAIQQLQSGYRKVPSLRTDGVVDGLVMRHDPSAIYQAVYYILFTGMDGLMMLLCDNGGDLSAGIMKTINAAPEIRAHMVPVADCVADFYENTQDMSAEEIVEVLGKMSAAASNAQARDSMFDSYVR